MYSQDSVDQIFSSTTGARRTKQIVYDREHSIQHRHSTAFIYTSIHMYNNITSVTIYYGEAPWGDWCTFTNCVHFGLWCCCIAGLALGVMMVLYNHNNINNNMERINNFVVHNSTASLYCTSAIVQ